MLVCAIYRKYSYYSSFLDETNIYQNPSKQVETEHVKNPFTGEEKEITKDELDSIEKQIEAQTERD